MVYVHESKVGLPENVDFIRDYLMFTNANLTFSNIL